MSLSNKQRYFIEKHSDWSADKIAKTLNVDIKLIKGFRTNLEQKEYPFWYKLFLPAIPLLFILILELGLSFSNYGYGFETFIETNENSEYLRLNPELTFKYFSEFKLPMNFIPDAFNKSKGTKTFRVFVLGGSSTAGWPFSGNEAFPRRIRRHLEIIYPEKDFEVINFGVSAVNSYFINDIVDDALLYNPDLVIIYAGHNEYYGALGVGASKSFGTSKFIVETVLWLREFKTYQLLESIVSGMLRLFASDGGVKDATTMEIMIGESEIPLNSDLYIAGIEQFNNNMSDMLEKISAKGIPVIFGKLTSNLEQKPFISGNNSESATSIYNEAIEIMNSGNATLAKTKFIKARELDLLRFRAPNEMNKVIDKLSQKFHCTTIDFDSLFSANSENHIPGYNIFVDHLHPTFKGHNLIGDEITKTIINHQLLITVDTAQVKLPIDSLISERYQNSKLDFAFADLTLRVLLGSFPFQKKGAKNKILSEFKGDSIQNRIAIEIQDGKITPLFAYKKIMDYYFNNSMFDNYYNEVSAFIDHRPYNTHIYIEGIKKLQSKNKKELALNIVEKLHNFSPSNYTNSVLGIINFDNMNYNNASIYFNNAESFDPDDEISIVYSAASKFMLGMDWMKNIVKDLESFYPKMKETAESYLKRRRLNEAEIFLEMMYQLHQDHFNTKWLGIIKVEKKKFDEAIPLLKESLNFVQRDAIVHYNLAVSFREEGEMDKAITAISESLMINPNFAPAVNWKRQHIK